MKTKLFINSFLSNVIAESERFIESESIHEVLICFSVVWNQDSKAWVATITYS